MNIILEIEHFFKCIYFEEVLLFLFRVARTFLAKSLFTSIARNNRTCFFAFSLVVHFAENGDFVEKGQVLVRLDDETFQQQLTQAKAGLRINQARLRQAEAGLSQLQGEFNREQKLNEQSLSSEVRIIPIQLRTYPKQPASLKTVRKKYIQV